MALTQVSPLLARVVVETPGMLLVTCQRWPSQAREAKDIVSTVAKIPWVSLSVDDASTI